jgi:RNA-directed DNA polymerase
LDRPTLRLLKAQGGRCPLCRGTLLHADREPNCPREWEEWFTAVRKAITRHNLAVSADADTPDDTWIRLVHSTCQRRNTKGAIRKNGTVTHPHRP